MKAGDIYQIESLELQRKRYPYSDALIVLNPRNIPILLQDFKDEGDEIEYD